VPETTKSAAGGTARTTVEGGGVAEFLGDCSTATGSAWATTGSGPGGDAARADGSSAGSDGGKRRVPLGSSVGVRGASPDTAGGSIGVKTLAGVRATDTSPVATDDLPAPSGAAEAIRSVLGCSVGPDAGPGPTATSVGSET
jgi:hypothetical protein